jgi:Chalcone isomerase-like
MKSKIKFVLSGICALALTVSRTSAAEISGVKLPDQVTVAGKSLKLNGTGLRQATILKVNVYAAGLYLEKPSGDGEAIANSDQTKSIEMAMIRDVSARQMAEAFSEGFDKNCVAGCTELKPHIAKLQGLLKDLKKGDTLTIHFLPDGVEVMMRGQKAGSVGDKAFSHQLIRCWIGKNPPNSGLKEGLLGGKK